MIVKDVVLWPSAYALAAWLGDKPHHFFDSATVLELGSGLALPAMVAALQGARHVRAIDSTHRAATLARHAARTNLPGDALVRFRADVVDFLTLERADSWGERLVLLVSEKEGAFTFLHFFIFGDLYICIYIFMYNKIYVLI